MLDDSFGIQLFSSRIAIASLNGLGAPQVHIHIHRQIYIYIQLRDELYEYGQFISKRDHYPGSIVVYDVSLGTHRTMMSCGAVFMLIVLLVVRAAKRGATMLKDQLMLMLKVFVVAHMFPKRRRQLLGWTLNRLGGTMSCRMM